VPGLAFRTQTGDWIDVPTVRDAFIVNGGQLLLRWTNDTFLATAHRAVNRTGGERYALAFFCDAQIDWPIAAVPTCVGPLRPPRYETTYYTDYMIGYQARTYNVFGDQTKDALAVRRAGTGEIRRTLGQRKGRPHAVALYGVALASSTRTRPPPR